MILVDTNVISEPLRKAPHTGVIEWIDSQPLETLYLSAITVAELRSAWPLYRPGNAGTRCTTTSKPWSFPCSPAAYWHSTSRQRRHMPT